MICWKKKGLVRHAKIFEMAARFQGVTQNLEAGTYQLDGRQDTPTVLQQLLKAPLEMQRLTIPEGLTRHEIASLLKQQGLVDSAAFVARTEDQDLIASLGFDTLTLEGYLFPETYFLAPNQNADGIIRQMVGQFHQVFNQHLQDQLAPLALTRHQAVTLASIVEKEAVVASEPPNHCRRLPPPAQAKSPPRILRYRGICPGGTQKAPDQCRLASGLAVQYLPPPRLAPPPHWQPRRSLAAGNPLPLRKRLPLLCRQRRRHPYL